MDALNEDSDSDVEILEPEVLKYRYRCQEIRLITALSKCRDLHIPKKWEDFQIFVQDELKFHLSPHLVRSVWVQLHSLINSVSDSFEIIDEEEDQEIGKQNNNFFSNIGDVISKELKPDNKGQGSNSLQSSAYLEIVDEEDSKEFVKQINHENGVFVQEEIIPGNKGKKSCSPQSSNSLEIIDKNEGREVVKQHNHNKSFSNTEGFIPQELKLSNQRKESCRSFNSLETINEECEINVNQLDDHFINIQNSEPDKKRRKSINTQLSDCLEIIDEKECEQVTKQHCEQFVITGGVIQELKPGDKGKKFFSEPLSNGFEIIDGEDKEIVKQHNEHFNVGGTIHDGLNHRNQDKEFCSQQSSDCVEISDDEEVKQIKQEKFITIGGVDHEGSKPDIKEEKTNNETLVSDSIEISSDEEVVNHYQQLSTIREGIQKEMKPDINGVKFDIKQLPDYLEISDEEENTNHLLPEHNGISKTSDSISNTILERSFSNPNGRKRKYNRCSLPASMKEVEAEALREKLLLDKIIELEIPQVIKSFMKKNNIVKKRRKKSSINKKESISGTSSDSCVPASN